MKKIETDATKSENLVKKVEMDAIKNGKIGGGGSDE